MEDTQPDVPGVLRGQGLDVEEWHRRAFGGRRATAWPPSGPFGTVAVRLPKAKDELEMLAHAAGAVLRPGGHLLVYGAKDEGIGSAPKRLEPVFGGVATVATGGRCRLLLATRPLVIGGLKGALDDWRVETGLPVEELGRPWVSFPGVFASGRLDAGTGLLISSMPKLTAGSRVLDFGCGSGVVGAVLLARQPDLEVDFLDVDAVALSAVRENLPDARVLMSDGLANEGGEPYDAIVANPPYHRRTRQTLAMIGDLVRAAPARLHPRGSMTLVVHRGLSVRGLLERSFGDLDTLAEDASYRVLMAWAPRPTEKRASRSRPIELPVYSKGTARGTPDTG